MALGNLLEMEDNCLLYNSNISMNLSLLWVLSNTLTIRANSIL